MKKSTKIAIILIVLVVAVVAIVLLANMGGKSNLGQIKSDADLTALVDKIYEGKDDLFGSLQTMPLDVNEAETVQSFTGLESGKDLEYLVVSEPMMSSQAYSLVLAKVKDGVNANDVAKTMSENINTRKWICVSAEKLYATNSGDVVCLVMSNEEMATSVYNSFKELAGKIGKEYEKTEKQEELPDDMLLD